MVRVELQTPIHDRGSGEVHWEALVTLTVDGDRHEIDGDEALLDLDCPVMSVRTGEQIAFSAEPEDWARSLVNAYRSGDLIATVVHDDAPVSVEEAAQAGAAA